MGILQVQGATLVEVDREIFFDTFSNLDLKKRKIANNNFRLGRITGGTCASTKNASVTNLISPTLTINNATIDKTVTPYKYTCGSGDIYGSVSTNANYTYLLIVDALSLGNGIPKWGFPSESRNIQQLHLGRNWWIVQGGGNYFDNVTSCGEVITNLQLFNLTSMVNVGTIPSIPETYDEFLLMTGMTDDYYSGTSTVKIPVQVNFTPLAISFDGTQFSLSEYMSYFPNGLHGDGKYYDEINFATGKIIKRFDDTGNVLDRPVTYNITPVTTIRSAEIIHVVGNGVGLMSIICNEEWG